MVIPDRGQIEVNDINIKNNWAYRNEIDYLPQIARFPENLRVSELLSMIKDLRKKEANDQPLIELFELEPFLDKRLSNLSGGTRQKVNIVLAMMYDSPIIIMDEPTAGLDPVAMISLKKLIREEKEKGKTILFTTHIMSLVEDLADEVIFLLEGKIYFRGSLPELLEQQSAPNIEQAIANILRKKKPVAETSALLTPSIAIWYAQDT